MNYLSVETFYRLYKEVIEDVMNGFCLKKIDKIFFKHLQSLKIAQYNLN